jgi:hypothetical protein
VHPTNPQTPHLFVSEVAGRQLGTAPSFRVAVETQFTELFEVVLAHVIFEYRGILDVLFGVDDKEGLGGGGIEEVGGAESRGKGSQVADNEVAGYEVQTVH